MDVHAPPLILIADDEQTIRDLTTRMIARSGYSVLTASSGFEAIALVRQHAAAISCVLLDISMPQPPDRTTLQAIHQICPGLAVIVMSGYNAQAVQQHTAGETIDGFIQKPFTLTDLRAALSPLLAPRQQPPASES